MSKLYTPLGLGLYNSMYRFQCRPPSSQCQTWVSVYGRVEVVPRGQFVSRHGLHLLFGMSSTLSGHVRSQGVSYLERRQDARRDSCVLVGSGQRPLILVHPFRPFLHTSLSRVLSSRPNFFHYYPETTTRVLLVYGGFLGREGP